MGMARRKGEKERAELGWGERGERRPRAEVGWAAWAGLDSDFLSSFPILFLFQIKFKPFEFKCELEFKPHPINKNYAPA